MPYVSAQYPENSTDSLPGDLPYFMTPDFNEIKPLSVYEPFVLCLILLEIAKNILLFLLVIVESVFMVFVDVIFLKVLVVVMMLAKDFLKSSATLQASMIYLIYSLY